MQDREPIYLDYQAHARLDPRVASSVADAFLRLDANPHSSHAAGEAARSAVEEARGQVAWLIGAEPSEIVFTSGATEANNLCFAGLRDYLAAAGLARVLVSAGEHPSVLAAAKASFAQVDLVPLTEEGLVDLDALSAMLGAGVGLVSIALANHEVGTIQPIEAISRLAHAAGALLHSDLAQAAGKVPVDARLLDLASLSSHKMCGPVGVGALFVRRSLRRRLRPILQGGGQEGGLRAGTVSAPLCHGFGEACRLALEEGAEEAARVATLRDDLYRRLATAGGVRVNGGSCRLPGNLNLSFDDVDGEALVLRLRGFVSISTGSACTSASLEPSHVLRAIGVTGRRAEEAVRISLGRGTTVGEVERAAASILDAVAALRPMARRVA